MRHSDSQHSPSLNLKSHHSVETEDEDADTVPRIAQWVGDDDFDEEDNFSDDNEGGPSGLETLQDDLSGLPFGALRRAQRVLAQSTRDPDSDSNDTGEHSSELDEPPESDVKVKMKPDGNIKPKTGITKRSNKHAPIEVTSKRPVSRKRTVVEVDHWQTKARDPRFLPLSGEFSAEKFRQQYSFLADSHESELKTLRENLKQARKLLASSPRDLLLEREKEVNRLELAMKRAESLANKDRRDRTEQEALTKVKQEEREKRKQGKAKWWLKESDKRKLFVRARYDALAAGGGQRAVKKAIEKRQKKVGQKEKKSRPFPKGGFGRQDSDNIEQEERPPGKRRRVG